MQFLKKFKEVSKQNSHTGSHTLTFSGTTVIKEVSLPPRVPVHTLFFFSQMPHMHFFALNLSNFYPNLAAFFFEQQIKMQLSFNVVAKPFSEKKLKLQRNTRGKNRYLRGFHTFFAFLPSLVGASWRQKLFVGFGIGITYRYSRYNSTS